MSTIDKYGLVQTERASEMKFPGQEVQSDCGLPLVVLCSPGRCGDPGKNLRVEACSRSDLRWFSDLKASSTLSWSWFNGFGKPHRIKWFQLLLREMKLSEKALDRESLPKSIA